MYVCLCNGIRDSELHSLADEGVRDVHEAYSKLDSEPVCRCCMEEAESILKSKKANVRGNAVRVPSLQKLPAVA